jgi:hypothetical protein
MGGVCGTRVLVEDIGTDGRVIIKCIWMGRCELDSSGSEQGKVMRFLNRMININLSPEAVVGSHNGPNEICCG